MRCPIVFLLLLLATPLCSIPTHAAGAEVLYRISGPSTLPKSFEVAIAGAAERLEIDLDLAAFEANPERLILELPGGRRIEVVRERYVEYAPDYISWVGALRPRGQRRNPGSWSTADRGYVHLIYHGDSVTGILNLPDGERYQLANDGFGNQQLVRIAATEGSGCGLEADAWAAGEEPGGSRLVPRVADEEAEETPGITEKAAGAVRLDLLALYPTAVLSAPGGEPAVRTFIQDSVAIANDVFAQSNVSAQYNIVHMGAIPNPQPTGQSSRATLAWLNTDPSAVVNLRNSVGADVVAVFVPLSWNQDGFAGPICGIANMQTTGGTCSCEGLLSTAPFNQRAFSAQRSGCGLNDLTFAHEAGHNYGMWHDSARNDLLFSWAFGRNFTLLGGARKASVMACNPNTSPPFSESQVVAGVCNRVPIFSDPNICHQRVPTGETNRHNARVARDQVDGYSDFRAPVTTGGVPMVRITSPACTTILPRNVTVTFFATASDPEQGNLSSQIRWRVNGVQQATVGATFQTSFAARADHQVTAVVTDSTGKSAEWSQPFTADNPPAADFKVSCTGLTCTYTSTSTDDGGIGSYSWAFGDGTFGAGSVATRTYAANGTYNVTLTVTDTVGQTGVKQRPITPLCSATSTQLCLQSNRFSVQLQQGGSFRPTVPFSDISGFFHFGNSQNLEVGVKVIDGTPVNGRWWVFHGAMTSLAYTTTVTDHRTQTTKSYSKPASSGSLLCGGADTGAFLNTSSAPLPRLAGDAAGSPGALLELPGAEPASISEKATCSPGSGYICLRGRFKVEVKRGGVNQAGAALTNESGVFWFFSSSTIEVPVKVLDGTPVNGKFWVFFGSLTDQSYQVVVTDTQTAAVRTYASPQSFCGLSDTAAF